MNDFVQLALGMFLMSASLATVFLAVFLMNARIVIHVVHHDAKEGKVPS